MNNFHLSRSEKQNMFFDHILTSSVFAFLLLPSFQLVLSNSNTNEYKRFNNSVKRPHGSCQLYNGSVCSEYLKDQIVYIKKGGTMQPIEEKLRRWFKRTQRTGAVSRECRPHAAALTCMNFYPKCNTVTREPMRKYLCSAHCTFIKKHICKGEFKRVQHSEYLQRYIPLCDEVSLFDDSNGDLCYFLPTINLNKAPVPISEPGKHIQKPSGKTALLKCSFGIRNFVWTKENSQMITEGTWYKDNRRVVGNKRMITRTRQKGKARLFMLLKIRNTKRKDQGLYRCVITFGNVTVENFAKLTVVNPVVVVVPNVLKNGITDKPLTVVKNHIKGRCVPYYPNGVCEAYFNKKNGNELVFEQSDQPHLYTNKQLKNVLIELKRLNRLSKECEMFGQAVLCLNLFEKCVNNTKKHVQSLCKRDCNLFKDVYCKEELKLIQSGSDFMSFFIPQCHLLSENNPHCINVADSEHPNNIPVSKIYKNQVHPQVNEMPCYDKFSTSNYLGTVSMTRTGQVCDVWNKYPGYKNIPHDYCRNFHRNTPWCFVRGKQEDCSIKTCPRAGWIDPTCYTNNGEQYYGTVSVSKSGCKCLPWNNVTFRYSNVDHSYCRNYDNDLEAPWCYVDKQKTKEICDIPKCVIAATTSPVSVSLVVYIVPAVVGGSVILFSLFLLVFYIKNKKILRAKKSTRMVLEKDSLELPTVTTLSTTASFDYNKETSEEESCSPLLEYKTPKKNRKIVPEVKESSLKNLVKIGDGKLGQLWQGEYVENRNRVIPVLIRKLKPETRSCIISEFRQEMNLLRGLKHRYFQQVICTSLMSEIPFVAFEYYHRLDLKEFLKAKQPVTTTDFLINCIYQVSSGLDYMHSHRILHKDVATRNCFISPDSNIQISKSGLGMYRYPNDYKTLLGLGSSPVRWLSPETLQTGIHRQNTDIFMFGVLIWELFSYGQQPYEGYDDDYVIGEVINGERLECPNDCPVAVWNIIEQCWLLPGCQRPSIALIKDQFKERSFEPRDQNINA